MASRNVGASAAAVQRPLYSPFEALQVNLFCCTAVLLGHRSSQQCAPSLCLSPDQSVNAVVV